MSAKMMQLLVVLVVVSPEVVVESHDDQIEVAADDCWQSQDGTLHVCHDEVNWNEHAGIDEQSELLDPIDLDVAA
eukprot:3895735-Amphidinium_carterae.1